MRIFAIIFKFTIYKKIIVNSRESNGDWRDKYIKEFLERTARDRETEKFSKNIIFLATLFLTLLLALYIFIIAP